MRLILTFLLLLAPGALAQTASTPNTPAQTGRPPLVDERTRWIGNANGPAFKDHLPGDAILLDQPLLYSFRTEVRGRILIVHWAVINNTPVAVTLNPREAVLTDMGENKKLFVTAQPGPQTLRPGAALRGEFRTELTEATAFLNHIALDWPLRTARDTQNLRIRIPLSSP